MSTDKSNNMADNSTGRNGLISDPDAGKEVSKGPKESEGMLDKIHDMLNDDINAEFPLSGGEQEDVV